MSDTTVVSRSRASPWPPFVAIGLAIAEAGVLFGSFGVAVAGVTLFGSAVTGMVTESDHLNSRSLAFGVVASVFAVLGGLVVVATSYQTRGEAVLVGAAVLCGLAIVDRVV